jgi:hypothetical protein
MVQEKQCKGNNNVRGVVGWKDKCEKSNSTKRMAPQEGQHKMNNMRGVT